MTLITRRDFDSRAGQERLVHAIHDLERKVRELDEKLEKCLLREDLRERDSKDNEARE